MSQVYIEIIDGLVSSIQGALKKERIKGANADNELVTKLQEEVQDISLLQQTATSAVFAGIHDEDLIKITRVISPVEKVVDNSKEVAALEEQIVKLKAELKKQKKSAPKEDKKTFFKKK